MNMINKSLASCIFSDYQNLLVTINDLGDSMINISFEGENQTILEGGLFPITSPNFYTLVTAEISVVKSSELAKEFLNQFKKQSVLSGSALLSFDNGESIKLENISFSIPNIESGGKEAAINISLKGAMRINTNLLF